MVELKEQQAATPVDMPRDGAGNIAYLHGNFFQSDGHTDGLTRPRRAHNPKAWSAMIVDPDILSKPAPSWQNVHMRYGLLGKVIVGPYYELGYRGHCFACEGYFLELDWAKGHRCSQETAFRDVTNREIRDYRTMRKVKKQFTTEQAQFTVQKQGIFSAIKNLITRNR